MACAEPAVGGEEQGMLSRWDQHCIHRVIITLLQFYKGNNARPTVKLSQAVMLLKSLFCAESTAQDPDSKRCHVSSKNNNVIELVKYLTVSFV